MGTKKRYLNLVVIGLLLLSTIFFILPKRAYHKRDLPEITQERVIHIVTNVDVIGYHASSDTIAGFNHDLLQLLQTYTKLKFDIAVENSLEKSFDGLKSGKYDVLARNIPINSELKKEFDFTHPIVHSKLILVQRKALYNKGIEPIRNHIELAQKVIYVAKDSPAILRLRNLAHEIGDTIYIKEDETYDASALSMMVAKGDIDYAVCDEKIAAKMLDILPEVDIKTDIGFTHIEAWAIRSDAPILRDSMDAWIARAQKTVQYKKIYELYY